MTKAVHCSVLPGTSASGSPIGYGTMCFEQMLHTACQGHVNSLDFSDMRGLLDNAAGEGGPDSAALPQDRRRSSDTHPVYYSGPCN